MVARAFRVNCALATSLLHSPAARAGSPTKAQSYVPPQYTGNHS